MNYNSKYGLGRRALAANYYDREVKPPDS